MNMGFSFFFNNILLGVGLAMDAFSVSLANGLKEPCMTKKKMFGVAGVFAFFQALMPLIGWLCVHTVVRYFQSFERVVPWIALILLCFIGAKMLFEKNENQDSPCQGLPVDGATLLIQGIATSIDALSVGFTIADYGLLSALFAALIIASVTWVICMGGLSIGKKAGMRLAGKANVLGGIILIFIGLEIFITG